MASGQQQQKETSVLIVRTAILGGLVGESFAIPTEEIKKCLSIAQSLLKHFNSCDHAYQARQCCERFCSWLMNVLEDIIGKSKK